MDAIARVGDTVTLEYKGSLDNKMVFTSSEEDGPITFEIGSYDVIKGLNLAVVGMKTGQTKRVRILSKDAFGDYDPTLVMKYALTDLPPNAVKGMQLKGMSDDGVELIWTLKEIDQQKKVAVLDGNHILAGQNVTFDIKLLTIKS